MADSVHCSHGGRDMKSQREGETKRVGWGETDRGEDRDVLSSGFFDGSHGCLYNKRLIANDSNRKKKGGGGITSIQMHSVCHLKPQTDNFTNKITAWNLTEWLQTSASPSQRWNFTDRTSSLWHKLLMSPNLVHHTCHHVRVISHIVYLFCTSCADFISPGLF